MVSFGDMWIAVKYLRHLEHLLKSYDQTLNFYDIIDGKMLMKVSQFTILRGCYLQSIITFELIGRFSSNFCHWKAYSFPQHSFLKKTEISVCQFKKTQISLPRRNWWHPCPLFYCSRRIPVWGLFKRKHLIFFTCDVVIKLKAEDNIGSNLPCFKTLWNDFWIHYCRKVNCVIHVQDQSRLITLNPMTKLNICHH